MSSTSTVPSSLTLTDIEAAQTFIRAKDVLKKFIGLEPQRSLETTCKLLTGVEVPPNFGDDYDYFATSKGHFLTVGPEDLALSPRERRRMDEDEIRNLLNFPEGLDICL